MSENNDLDVYNGKASDKNIVGGSYPNLSSTVEPYAVQYLSYAASYLFRLDINTLTERIQQWSIDRNLPTSDKKSQLVKVVEEVGEVAAAIARGDDELLQDAIGDVFVTIVILSQCSGLDFTECVRHAYNEIKDRKGKLVDGIFIKEE
jgi:NTP pyrophosphatase (non-canonical NTP hydrolase)